MFRLSLKSSQTRGADYQPDDKMSIVRRGYTISAGTQRLIAAENRQFGVYIDASGLAVAESIITLPRRSLRLDYAVHPIGRACGRTDLSGPTDVQTQRRGKPYIRWASC